MKKVETVKIGGGADYAKVKDRLIAFRSSNPRAKIETTPIKQEDGMMLFKAHILVDKSDEYSAEATGHALQIKQGTKDFEKLETIAVGRALALLGYGADGEIASSEEMQEFEDYKKEQKQVAITNAIEQINDTKTIEELKTVWTSLGNLIVEKEVQEAKELQKTNLTK